MSSAAAGPPSSTTLNALQAAVRALRERHGMQVPAGAALLDACAELGELAGAYLKHHDYRLDAPAGPHDQLPADVRAEYGDVLFAVLSFAAAAGIDAERELLQTLSRYEIRFGS